MYRRILVPLDGSELAERILPHAQSIAQGTGAEVLLLRVISAFAPITTEAATDAQRWVDVLQALAANYLDGVGKRLRDVGIPTKIGVLLGDPAVEILTAAERTNVDLIAMMSHGATGLNTFDRGGVAEKILKSSPRPVLMARAFRSVLRQLDEQEVWAIKA